MRMPVGKAQGRIGIVRPLDVASPGLEGVEKSGGLIVESKTVNHARIAIVTCLMLAGGVGISDVRELRLTTASVRADVGQMLLRPTVHAPVPRALDGLWLVPSRSRPGAPTSPVLQGFARGVDLIGNESFAEARPLVSHAALAKTPLADYAAYYSALVHLRTGAAEKARDGFRSLNQAAPVGVLGEWGLLGEAMAAEQVGDAAAAAILFEGLSRRKTEQPDLVLAGLARTLVASNQKDKAVAVYRDLYLDYPLSSVATEAWRELERLTAAKARPIDDPAREFKRAERLFEAKRYAEALAAFETLTERVQGDDREIVGLRIAESHFYLGRHRQALEAARPFIGSASRKAEARFFHLSALRGIGDHDSYVAEARKLVANFSDSSWSEEALNNLGTHYILANDDAAAATVFAEYLDKFPRGRYAARASWKFGWFRYRQGDFESAASVFDRAAAHFPRSDNRPAWLYWSAKCYDRLKQAETASARYALLAADYLHSYYGRLADEQLTKRHVPPAARQTLAWREDASGHASSAVTDTAAPAFPANAAQIRQLVSAGLHSTAQAEVRHAQRQWGSSPVLDATLAWLLREQGQYRAAITVMKRAYPQYLADEGHLLPVEARKVIFPLDYWPLIQKHASRRGLDPYLIAALVAQESSFDADVRSPANAYGLMQIVPATGKRLARSLGIRRFSTSTLTNPEMNVRMGTLYFKNLVKQFGGAHYALASYNAGESRVVRWRAERGELPPDEFIDDIPFPETQHYVKKILGTAEDYRQLY